MQNTFTVQVSRRTHRRLSHLSKRLGESPEEVIARGLDAVERELFWEGGDEEAAAYLERYGELEAKERESFHV